VVASVLIVGASHQGEVVLDILRADGSSPRVAGFLDAGTTGRFVGRQVEGIPVLGTLADLPGFAGRVEGAIPAVGDAREREDVVTRIEASGIPLVGAVHPRAHVAPSAVLAAGAVVSAGAVIAVGARIGRGCIVNTGAIVDHHCRVDDFAHIAPGACLTGGVTVGRRAWVGAGAVIREDLTIGEDAVVGAGAVVIRDVAAGTTVVGVPARPLAERPQAP
jgi:sugar O-acyltransferase (sialic acid O-acetyltransferase NeuD family)